MCRPFLTLSMAFLLAAAPLAAQPRRPAQAGEIELQAVEKKIPPQQAVLNYFTELNASLDRLAAGEELRPGQLSEKEMLHLNAAYLFCSIRKGTCAWILDALLESDVINARLDKRAECPNMHYFWKLWIKNDLQRKHDFQTQTGFMRETLQFRKQQLPRYLSCSQTVAAEIAGDGAGQSNAGFFTKRYGGNSSQKQAVAQLVAYLEAIKSKNVDVFGSTGISMAPGAAQAGGAKKKSPPSSAPRKTRK